MTLAAIIGAGAGLLLGIADYVALGAVARSGRGPAGSGGPLKLVRMASIVVFPIVGWFAGPYIASSLGG